MTTSYRPTGRPYQDFSKADVDQAEPLAFPEAAPAPVAFPRIVLQTTIEYAGFVFNVTFNDTSIAEAAAVLEKRGCVPAGRPAQAPQAAPAPQASVPTCINRNCSRYGQPMAASQHSGGWYCTGKDPTTGNAKGYCKETS